MKKLKAVRQFATKFTIGKYSIVFIAGSLVAAACGPTVSSTGLSQSSVVIDTTTAEAQAVISIMNAQCVSCHGASGAGQVSNINDLNAVYAQGLIVPGSPNTSLLLQEIEGNTMPPMGGPLSSADQTTIRDWIQNL